jgi:Domain of unknown function (DUF4476)
MLLRCAPLSLAILAWSSWGQSTIRVHSESRTGTHDITLTSPAQEAAPDYQLTFETNPQGQTVMRVVAPEGARCEIWDDTTLVYEDAVPLSFSARGDRVYRFRVKLSDGRSWERRLGARSQRTGSLSVNVNYITPPPPDDPGSPAPERPAARLQGMGEADFARLQEALENESLPQQKWAVLQTAIGTGARFTVAQVGQLISLFDASAQKVSVVEVTRTRIVDRKNLFQLYASFDTEAEKQKVRSLLGQ